MSLLYPQSRNVSIRSKSIYGLHICQAMWSPHYLLGNRTGEAIITNKHHALYKPTLHKYMTRSKDGLWWLVTSHTIQKKRVVRSWASRRLRHAIVEALRAQGLDEEGRVLTDSSVEAAGGLTQFSLRGTLRVTAMPPLVFEKYSVVQKEVRDMISQVIGLVRLESRAKEYLPIKLASPSILQDRAWSMSK